MIVHNKIKILDRVKIKTMEKTSSPPPLSNHLKLPSQFISKNNIIYKERPLKTNSQNLSFKGLSFVSVSESIEKFGSIFGEAAKKDLRMRIETLASIKSLGLELKEDTISFKNSTFANRFVNMIKYPFVNMPLDVTNSTLKMFKKIPRLKNSKFVDEILNSSTLKRRSEFLKHNSQVSAIEHYFEMLDNPRQKNKIFNEAHKRFNPLVSNYDGTAERTLTRLVTGIIPAFFLANDAYNLSIYMNDNKEMAKTEKKRRFNQEVARIGLTAGATFATLSLFSKNTKESTVFLMSALTFVSEIIGRMIVGSPVLPLDGKEAKKYAKHRKSPKVSKSSAENQKKFKKSKKGTLTIKSMLKVVGVLMLAGFGIEKASSNIKFFKKALNFLNDKYKALYQKDNIINRRNFNILLERLDIEGFKPIADKYRTIVEEEKGDLINIGKSNDKTKHMLIHNILTFPIRFAWSTLMTPYKVIAKPLASSIYDGVKNLQKFIVFAKNAHLKTFEEIRALKEIFNKKPTNIEELGEIIAMDDLRDPENVTFYNKLLEVVKESPKTADELEKKKEKVAKEAKEMLRNSLEFFKKVDKKSSNEYKTIVNNAIFESLDNVTKSNFNASALATVIKNSTSAITSAFLIADNYNLVMINSQGKNKDLAEQKAKERTIQRGVRLAYGAFLIKFFNGLFAKTMSASLLGAEAINALYAITTENLERRSVGLPTTASSKREIRKMEKENLEATGAKGRYYKFMAKLTGKKIISERQT